MLCNTCVIMVPYKYIYCCFSELLELFLNSLLILPLNRIFLDRKYCVLVPLFRYSETNFTFPFTDYNISKKLGV